jgi:hypothetical protein
VPSLLYQARYDKGFVDGVRQKNNLLIAAVLEEIKNRGIESTILADLPDRILARAALEVQ